MKRTLYILVILSIFLASCKKEPVFVAPDFELVSYSLKEFPGDSIFLDVDVNLYNNDDREADINEITYQVFVEEYSSELETVKVDQVFKPTEPLHLTLPVRVATETAIALINQLEFGEELSYRVVGSVKLNNPVLKLFELPFDVAGAAMVEVGYDEFYQEPQLAFSGLTANYTIINLANYRFDFLISCLIQNPNPYSIRISRIDYLFTLENIESEPQTCVFDTEDVLLLPAEGAERAEFPLTFLMNIEQALPFIEAIVDGEVEYHLTGEIQIEAVNEVPFEKTIEFSFDGK